MKIPWQAEVFKDTRELAMVNYYGDEGEAFVVLFFGPWAGLRADAYAQHIQPIMDDEGAYEAGG